MTMRPTVARLLTHPRPTTTPAALLACALTAATTAAAQNPPPGERTPRPNVVLLMADDLGYGDLGCQGHPELHTPHLDRLAADGVRFTRFHAAAPVCSPTRASCLTGRHPLRCDVPYANQGHLGAHERTLQQLLHERGYRTGHFGKWHLGTLSTTVRDSNRGGPDGAEHFAPPWQRDFDVCFSTEAKVPTFDPMQKPGTDEPFGTHYWNERGEVVTDGLEGDDSRVIMDRVLPFVRAAASDDTPFLAVVWFHAPHLPVVASAADRARYGEHDERTQHYYGCITALDREVGRLRALLDELELADDTIVWFCSDNGPEGAAGKAPGSAGGLRGRKRSLYEGGTRVPGLLAWPGHLPRGLVVDATASTSDLLPTICAWTGAQLDDRTRRRLDGIDIAPLLTKAAAGERPVRGRAIGFESRRLATWTGDRHKLVAMLARSPASLPAIERLELFDLAADPRETTDVAAQHPQVVERMRAELQRWREAIRERP